MTHLSSPLWLPAELPSALGSLSPTQPAYPVSGISIDTRSLQPGDLFFALPGPSRDGHTFLESAAERGAAGAVVRADLLISPPPNLPLYAVSDVLHALEDMGRASRQRTQAHCVAVTGSVGKTSSKDMLQLVLNSFGSTHSSAASYNNHWGVPLTLARMPRITQYGVFEIGMSHAGEITPLTQMVRPDVAIITHVALVHAAHFASIEAIADAKAEIMLGVGPAGHIILPRDNPMYERLLSYAMRHVARDHILSFGAHEDADIRLLSYDLRTGGGHICADVAGNRYDYTLPTPGEHVARNSLAILAATHVLGLDTARVVEALGHYLPPSGRGNITLLTTPKARLHLVDESYNANPTSVEAALKLLGARAHANGGHTIAVLGDMLELGENATDFHLALAPILIKEDINYMFAVGHLMQACLVSLPPERQGAATDTSAQMLAPLLAKLEQLEGDIWIMIKGSNSMNMKRLIADLSEHFSSSPRA